MVCGSSKARTTVLHFFPGGFTGGSNHERASVRICRGLARAGYRAVTVDYPLFTLRGAVKSARRAAERYRRSGRRLIAVGTSAGGTLAGLLAARGQVDGAVTFAAPLNLLRWRQTPEYWAAIKATGAARRASSPVYQLKRPKPTLVMHDERDYVVPFSQATEFVRRNRAARLKRVNGYAFYHAWGPRQDRLMYRWLAHHAR